MSIDYYIKVSIVLAFFSFFLFLALYFTKKISKKRFTGEIEVMDRISINQHVSLMLVSTKGHVFFISVGSQNASLLYKIS